jgi:hypothetical protein
LKANDLHIVFNDTTNRLKLFDAKGKLVFACEARNDAVAGPGFGHNGDCPRGEFVLGPPRKKGTAAFGAWFIPILDGGAGGPMQKYGRAGIGIHGGGSGLKDPFAPEQGWVKTHGCVRVQNRELAMLTEKVKGCLAAGGRIVLSVSGEAA